MLSYLVSSSTRRRLLLALWRDGARGTASSLARRADTPVAATYRELGAMVDAGLAKRRLESGHLVYEADGSCPYAKPLRKLLAPAPARPSRAASKTDDAVRDELVARGAPLWKRDPSAKASMPLPELLARACDLSHRDPTVAKVLPYVLLRSKEQLDLPQLLRGLQEVQQKHTAAMFFAVAASLSGDPELSDWAEQLRDGRRRKTQDFFDDAGSPRLRALSERNTPEVVRSFNYRMNMSMDEFRSVLEKFPLDDQVPG